MQPMNKMRSTGHHHNNNKQRQSKFLRIVTTPYRALCRARDLYVRSVIRCGQPPSFVSSKSKSNKLPRSFSAASSVVSTLDDNNEDYRELVRAASVRTLRESSRNIVETETTTMMMMMIQPRSVRRSVSVGIGGMGRIDEEAPFDEVEGIGEGDGIEVSGVVGSSWEMKMKKRGDLLYPRSKSYAVVNNRNVAF